MSETGQKPIVRYEETEKTTYRGHAATGARVQRENHFGIVYEPVYRQVSISLLLTYKRYECIGRVLILVRLCIFGFLSEIFTDYCYIASS